MIQQIDIPADTLIAEHRTRIDGFADSFMTRVPQDVSLATYVEAFYTTPVFRTERMILGLAGHKSSDQQARNVAQGEADRFAIWGNPIRRDGELLMQEASGATSSWFMTRKDGEGTELYFGTTVRPGRPGAKKEIGAPSVKRPR